LTPVARFEPTIASLRRHEVPAWYHDAKLGIFVHWSLGSVPGFAPRELEINELLRTRYRDMLPLSPYTEWYENAIKFPWSPSARWHREHHGGRPYESFKDDFVAGLERWDPGDWAERFRRAGARYVVFVTKHHDGFCLWPSRVAHPHREGWNTGRDVVGEMAEAVRARGMRFGVYYSGGIDWSFEPRPVRTFLEFVASMPRGAYPDYAEAQVRELIERYQPDVLWNDISWPAKPDRLWRLLADYYEAMPEGVINDRWLTAGPLIDAMRIAPLRWVADRLLERRVRDPDADLKPPAPPVYDARTPEYAVFDEIRREKWECVRGMDKSFGYNRESLPEDFLSKRDLLHSLVDIVSKNGNLLLNVGPRGEDAGIPEPQQERLDWLGAFLGASGEALYGTRPWERAEGTTREGAPVRFTARGDTLHAIVLAPKGGAALTLADVPWREGARVECLGGPEPAVTREGDDLRVVPAAPAPDGPLALRLRGVL
jgi:alpha-L-fucosidase